MWLYPLPSVLAWAGWVYVLAPSGWTFVLAGLAVLANGVAAFVMWRRWGAGVNSGRGIGSNLVRALQQRVPLSLEVAVTAHESCVDGEGGCSYPEVVLIERLAAALPGDFQPRAEIASGLAGSAHKAMRRTGSGPWLPVPLGVVLEPAFPSRTGFRLGR